MQQMRGSPILQQVHASCDRVRGPKLQAPNCTCFRVWQNHQPLRPQQPPAERWPASLASHSAPPPEITTQHFLVKTYMIRLGIGKLLSSGTLCRLSQRPEAAK